MYETLMLTVGVTFLMGLVSLAPVWAPQLILGDCLYWHRVLVAPTRFALEDPLRFTLGDGFVLMIALAIGNGLAGTADIRSIATEVGALTDIERVVVDEPESSSRSWADEWTETEVRFLRGLFVSLGVVGIWLLCQQFMRTNQIFASRDRILTQTVLYPLSILACSGLLATVLLLAVVLNAVSEGWQIALSMPAASACVLVGPVAVASCGIARRLCRRYVRPPSDLA